MSNLTLSDIQNRCLEYDIKRNRVDLDEQDLAKSIIIECAELLEHYQRDNLLTKRGEVIAPKDYDKIGLEYADILIYLIKFCRQTNIDLGDAFTKKMEKIEAKYPPVENMSHEEYIHIKETFRKEGKN